MQQLKRSRAEDAERRAARQAEIEAADRDDLTRAEGFLLRARDTRAMRHIAPRLPAAALAVLARMP